MLMTRLTCLNKDPLCAKGFIFLCPPVREMSGKPFECRVRWLISASFFCCLFNGWKQIKQFSPAVTEQKFVFVFVWFLAGRKAQRLPKSKQENRLHGLFCSYLSATDVFGETKELRIPAEFFTVYRNRFHTVCMWTPEFPFAGNWRILIFFSCAILSSRARFLLLAWRSSREEGSWYFVSENTLTCNDTDAKRSSPFPTFFIGLKTAKIDLQDLSKLLQTRLPRIARVGEMSLVQVFNS